MVGPRESKVTVAAGFEAQKSLVHNSQPAQSRGMKMNPGLPSLHSHLKSPVTVLLVYLTLLYQTETLRNSVCQAYSGVS